MQAKESNGLNPFATTKTAANSGIQEEKENSNLAHLAHINRNLGSVSEMRKANVTLKTGGKRWYVEYYVTSIDGKRERKREYGYVNKEKEPSERMKLLLSLQQEIYHKVTSPVHKTHHSINVETGAIYKATLDVIEDKKMYLLKASYNSTRKNLKPFLSF